MSLTKRPKIEISKTKSEWLMDMIGYIALAIMLIVLFMNWRELPNEVPAHFDGSGNVDRWGSRWELLILPGIGIAMHFFLMIFEKFPETHNYPARINESNAEVFYRNSRQTLNYMRNIINIIAYISIPVCHDCIRRCGNNRLAIFRHNGSAVWCADLEDD